MVWNLSIYEAPYRWYFTHNRDEMPSELFVFFS